MNYHDEPSGDGLRAAVTQLPKLSPVVLPTEQTSIFLIVPAGQRRTAFTASVTELTTTSDMLWLRGFNLDKTQHPDDYEVKRIIMPLLSNHKQPCHFPDC